MRNKSNTNFIIDTVMLLLMMALTGTGYVRKYILLSGRAAREAFGSKVEMTLLGMNRDSWATIHLYIGYILLFFLLLHIILHWNQIKVMYRKLIPNETLRLVLLTAFVLAGVLLVIFPFIIKPHIGY